MLQEHYRFIDDTIAENMDLSAQQLFAVFKDKFASVHVSLSTIKRVRLELGWMQASKVLPTYNGDEQGKESDVVLGASDNE